MCGSVLVVVHQQSAVARWTAGLDSARPMRSARFFRLPAWGYVPSETQSVERFGPVPEQTWRWRAAVHHLPCDDDLSLAAQAANYPAHLLQASPGPPGRKAFQIAPPYRVQVLSPTTVVPGVFPPRHPQGGKQAPRMRMAAVRHRQRSGGGLPPARKRAAQPVWPFPANGLEDHHRWYYWPYHV